MRTIGFTVTLGNVKLTGGKVAARYRAAKIVRHDDGRVSIDGYGPCRKRKNAVAVAAGEANRCRLPFVTPTSI